MPQIFPKSMNPISRFMLLSIPVLAASAGVALSAFYRSDYTTGRNEIVEQPIPFSHLHHVAELGIDCRYCHTAVENSAYAGIPPSKTCINCHQQIWNGADILGPLRESYNVDKPIVWTKVHNVPHYTYFNHSIHVSKGVGCASCHARIDQMPLVYQSKTLLMEWCLDCHRNPEKNLRPKSEIFNLAWKPSDGTTDLDGRVYDATTTSQAEMGRELKEKYHVRDGKTLTNCSICHR
jgi:Cytochrome c7 and related cytochrome c